MNNKKQKLVLLIFGLLFALVLSACAKTTTVNNSVSLSFDTNGGNAISAVSVEKGTEYTLPTPTKEGHYEFEGWYASSDLSGEALTVVTAESDQTYYAKWEQLYAVTLDLNGGSYSSSEIYGKAGDKVEDLLKDVTPTKANAKFAGWYNGTTLVNSSTKLTEKGITVTARYDIAYTVNVYKQNIADDDYTLEVETYYATEGKTVEADVNYVGFTLDETNENNVDSITINADASKNVMTLYFLRDTYTVTFRSNYPVEDAEDETYIVTIRYGENLELPETEFSIEGYYLVGYATSPDALEITYDAHFFDNLAYNETEETERETVFVTADRNTSLYAIWAAGYKNMFGDSDYIYVIEGTDTAYLCRGNVYFKGQYDEDTESYIFGLDEIDDYIECKVYENGTYAYSSDDRDEYTAKEYVVGSGLSDTNSIKLGYYNEISYYEGSDKSTGTYVIDENGYYVATFTEGTKAGETLTMILGYVTDSESNKVNAFQVRNEEEYNTGKIVRFAIYNNNLTYYTSAYDITLSGFGTLSYNTGSSYSTYYYTLTDNGDDTFTLVMTNSSGSTVGTAIVWEYEGTAGYMLLNESYKQTWINDDGSTLSMDGISTATYINGDTKVSGYYSVTSSVFGGYIVTFEADGVTYTFLTKTTSEEVTSTGDDGEETTSTVYHYTFTVKPEGYTEYYYRDAEGYYYAPLFVVNDMEDGELSIYGYNSSKAYELACKATYTYDESTELYTVVVTEHYEYSDTVFTTTVDFSKIEKVVCALDTSSTQYQINYWYSSVLDGVETNYVVNYTNTLSDGATLTIVNGMAIYSKDGYKLVGSYTTKSGVTTITGYINSTSVSRYIELDEENKTFTSLLYSPYSAYVVLESGSYSANEYMSFDGKGNATYVANEYALTTDTELDESKTYYTKGEDDTYSSVSEPNKDDIATYYERVTYTGTIADTDKTTAQGLEIYSFTSAGKSFEYIAMTSSSNGYTYIFQAYGNYTGDYTSEEDGILTLDGFGYAATYTDADGNNYTNYYVVYDENVIRIAINSKYRYFDLNGKTFTLRGAEYGAYILMDNQGMPGEYVEFDGYGKASVFTYSKEENEEGSYDRVYIAENAEYAEYNGLYTIYYGENNELSGYLSTYTYNSTTYNTFVVNHEEVVFTFVDDNDWSVLVLDAIGNATLYDNVGAKETGTYMIIDEGLIYYVNSEASNANIYKFSMADGTITTAKYTAIGYYTSDLKSLLFSKYGFAIFNGETRYYYTIAKEAGTDTNGTAYKAGDYLIYHQDAENEKANEYGFVMESFGEITSVKEYNGATYYQNDGYALNFTRVEATKDKYPVQVSSSDETKYALEKLTFTPSGTDEFSVTGTVLINGTSYSCTVVRTKVMDSEEDFHYDFYVQVGYYRFDITATYGADEVTYEILSMSYTRSFYPYTYLQYYYMIYSFFGSTYAANYQNKLGMFYWHMTFDEEGNKTEDYYTIDFYEGYSATDLNGELLGVEKGEYETYGESTGIYTVKLDSTDGYTYTLYFALKYYSTFQTYAYQVYGVTRTEVLTDGDYTLTIERTIASDYSEYSSGTIFLNHITLKKGETEFTDAQYYTKDGVLNYIVRTTDEETGKITSTVYYKLTLTEKEDSSMDEEESTLLMPYASMKVAEVSATTYSNDNGDYVDVIDGKVTLIYVAADKSGYIPSDSSYDEETKTYTVTLSGGEQYTIKVADDNSVTVTLVVTEPEEDTETEEE